MSDAPEHECYVGKAPCGHYVYAAVDVPEMKDVIAEDIAKMIRQGFTIERKPVQWVRDGGLDGLSLAHEECKRKKKNRRQNP